MVESQARSPLILALLSARVRGRRYVGSTGKQALGMSLFALHVQRLGSTSAFVLVLGNT